MIKKYLRTLYVKCLVHNKYSTLLFSLIGLFLFAPLIDRLNRYFPLTHLLIYAIIILTLQVLTEKKKYTVIVASIGAVALGLEFLVDHKLLLDPDNITRAILYMSYIVFIGSAIILLIKNIFAEKSVSGDTIKGAISIYLLMGFWWTFLYSFLLIINSGAIVSTTGADIGLLTLYQFSFATLTTVGYGNTIPKTELAVTLSNFEAVAGQMYLAVLIARLVGLNLFKSLNKK